MKNLRTKLIIVFFLCSIITNAQVGIGTPTPEATLDITAANPTGSTTNTVDGILIPRVDRERVQSMASIPISTLVYVDNVTTGTANLATINVTSVGFYFFNGSVWEKLGSGATNGWSVTGNTGLSGTTNFLGTTDDVDVAFRRNNVASGKIGTASTSFGVNALNAGVATNSTAFGTNALVLNTGANNVAVGNGVLSANTIGIQNTGIGNAALAVNTGNASTAVGFEALTRNTTASNNTGIGFQALTNNTIGTQNTAVGFQSSNSNSTGNNNTSVGFQALANNIAGDNTAIGHSALGRINNAGAIRNTAVGSGAMFASPGNISNTTAIGYNALFQNSANNNTAVGYFALQGNTSSLGNTAVGAHALNDNTGSNNTALGFGAGYEHGSGSNNTYIGFEAGRYNTTTTNNNAFLGYQAGLYSTGSFNTAIGSNTLKANAATANNVAIGYNALTTNGSTNNTAVGYGALSGNTAGTGNVAIGYNAGSAETGSNKLYIENSNANVSNALIYGEFDTNILRVNGTLQVNNPAGVAGYALPNVRGTAGQVLQTNGAGTTSWVSPAAFETDPQVSSTTNNFVPRWNGTALVDGVIRDNGTNVGIGAAATAGNKLDVTGNTRTTNFQMTSGATPNYFLQSDINGNGTWAPIPANTVMPFTTTGTSIGTYDVSLSEYTIRVYNDVSEVRLPSAPLNTGKVYIIIGSDGISSKLFSSVAGAIYDDVTDTTITNLNANQRYMVQSDGNGWLVIGR